mgnify:CR=1 FL=1
MLLSTSTPEQEVLAFINDHLTSLFIQPPPPPIQSFRWDRSRSKRRDRWAGWYQDRRIHLDPQFFSGIADPKQQHQAIEDVLLHELCHHIQYLTYPHSPMHGREFRELAYYVNGKMGRDAVTIYHSLAKTPEGQEAERAQRKALALLARTTSSNEHEASLAAAKYAQFVAQNNITLDAHAETLANGLPVMVEEHIWTAKQMTASLSYILNAVAHVNGCTFAYWRTGACTKIRFYGRPSKISQSYDLIEYLTEAVDRVVKKEQAEDNKVKAQQRREGMEALAAPRGRSYWIAFREGVARRAAQALLDDHKRRMAEGMTVNNGINHIPGLVLQSAFEKEQTASDEFMSELHPKLGKGSRLGARSHSGRSAGYAAGSAISVARQACGSSTRSLAAAR